MMKLNESIHVKRAQLKASLSSLMKNKRFKKFLPFMILAVGVIGMGALALSRPVPQKQAADNPGALVEIMTVTKEERQVIVAGTGTVQPRREVNITPQVSGRIAGMSSNFVAGGFFRKGQLLFKIEDVDYKLAVDRSRGALARAEYDLATVDSQARIARMEWERLKLTEEGEANPLALYEPQLKNAKTNVASAKAALTQAQLDLERTKIYAPFNCRVRSEEIDIGQYVRAGTSVAVLAGTDTAEVIVPLPFEEMQWLSIPRPGTRQKGSPANVYFTSGDTTYAWQGNIVRSLGEVDSRGRMARVVVSIEDPYGLKKRNREKERPPLEVGMFVNVALQGKSLSGVYTVPRSAVRDNSTVWIMDEQNLMRIHPIQVVRLEQKEALITNGLEEGTKIVLTTVSGAADGMKLRPILRQPERQTEPQVAEQEFRETSP